MLYAAIAVFLQIWVRANGEVTELTTKQNDVVKSDFSDKCTHKGGCFVSYQGSGANASPREICDARCRPLSCVWLSVENSTHLAIQCGRKLPMISKEKAKSFLHTRIKRSLNEECREGCSWEEVGEVRGSSESIVEYMRYYVCNIRSTCPSGQICTVTGSYSHSNNLHVTCTVHTHQTVQYSGFQLDNCSNHLSCILVSQQLY